MRPEAAIPAPSKKARSRRVISMNILNFEVGTGFFRHQIVLIRGAVVVSQWVFDYLDILLVAYSSLLRLSGVFVDFSSCQNLLFLGLSG